MNIQERIKAFVELGSFLEQFTDGKQEPASHRLNDQYHQEFTELLARVSSENLWFTPEHVQASIKGICFFLRESNINKWLKSYKLSDKSTNTKVAVIMAGNIPMVGFHDMLSVLMAGHTFIGKLSTKDNKLLDFIAKLLISLQPEFEKLIRFEVGQLNASNGFDAIIATGSNNSARYFDAYFSKYPNIIRRNRNSVALISGNESEKEIKALGNDIFLYFGLGCRNVSKLYIPENYDITQLFKHWEVYQSVIDHSKYANNYDYQRSLLLMNKIHHFDNGFLLLQENSAIASPVGVVYYEYYSELQDIKQKLKTDSELIQCVVASDFESAIPFGKAQEPQLWDYADNVDTMQFLTRL
ncbi:acyl-CoA reductase [Marinifilum caeruleilacunae]|uniref:Acyl-CoA reductase n=1 Tax=Marinifilum caeruleilacunae TaxID=2499076 RepID=A0ABX1WYK6_9BACT|nr:acyl-CoA reductase [Marinifilum caeruleilacunae]NOU61196.1 acyl-CoA reductase [Marinifilum caeruleilacunae]